MSLSPDELAAMLASLEADLPLADCRSCECLQGFLTQLEMDGGEASAGLIAALKMPRDALHGCLGCDPCPPAAAFSRYITRGKSAKLLGE